MMKSIKSLLLSLFALAITASASAFTIKGSVIDKLTHEPLIGATVIVKGTTRGVTTNLEGQFEIELGGESQTLSFAYISYTTQDMSIESKADQEFIEVEMESDNQLINAVTVSTQVVRQSEYAAMADQKNSLFATQVVGVKELSRKGVGDAEGAVMKVSGVSKSEGVKNIFVRGLGDRYNATTLNGLPIPSEDPEYKNISLDFFSTDIIESVIVNKAFYAQGVSDAGGANLNITSNQLSSDGELSISVSGGVNAQTLGADLLVMDGVNGFGFANNTKPSDAAGSYDFANRLSPSSAGSEFDRSIAVSGGKRFEVAGNPLTLYMVATYDRDASYTDEISRSTTATNTIYRDQEASTSQINTSYLGLANLNYSIGDKHRLDYNFMYVHNNSQSVGVYDGFNSEYENWGGYESLNGVLTRQQTNDNSLYINQILSKWSIAPRLKLDVAGSYNYVVGLEPDRRINIYGEEEDGSYTPARSEDINQRFFSELKEGDANAQAAVTYSLSSEEGNKSALKVGYTGRFVETDFAAEQYNQPVIKQVSVDGSDLAMDDFFNAENLADGYFTILTSSNEYQVSKSIHSAYADLTYEITDRFTANVGVKYDIVDIEVTANLNGITEEGGLDNEAYFLPSMNLRYDLSEKHSLRLSASQTYTLPQAKELSPYQYVGVNFNSEGNPDLKPSDNYNVDLKWDWYISRGELLSITGFYKYIANPISRTEINSAGGFLSYQNVADSATAAGVEVEFRKDLYTHKLGDGKSNKLSWGVNGSYIYTYAEVVFATDPTGSQLEGAAPIIANTDLSFSMIRGKKTFTNTVVFNYVSDKVYTIGTGGYNDIIENSISTLDFVSTAKLSDKLSLSLKAKNLLNPEYALSRESNSSSDVVILSQYTKGIDISLGLSYNF